MNEVMETSFKTNRLSRRQPSMPTGSRAIDRLRTEVDRLLDDFIRGYWHVPFRRSVVDVEPYWRGEISFGATPAVDIVDKDDQYKLTAELPAVGAQNIEIRFSNGTLTIEGQKQEAEEDEKLDHFLAERHYGDFRRSFRVPDGVDPEKIEASTNNGVLTVTLPKAAAARRTEKKVQVKAA